MPNLREHVSSGWFQIVHRTNLVYNTCWEDPRLDRAALRLGPQDTLLAITSAGCNVLDYALEAPRRIEAVDLNPRQNALLELKIAGIRRLDFGTFFGLFGHGVLPDCRAAYQDLLREELSEPSRRYWDQRITFFDGRKRGGSFYFRGTAGFVARSINRYLDRVVRVRAALDEILCAATLDEQRQIYESRLRGAVWTRFLRWLMNRDATLSLLGVPRPQRQQVERHYPGGIAQFIEDAVETVFARLPLHDNYFWRVYLTGRYTESCCPEYLKRSNFELLKSGLVDCIRSHTTSVQSFLRRSESPVSRFVLLDHMDWLSTHRRCALAEEWQALLDRAAPGARLLWRSGGLRCDFVDELTVRVHGRPRRVGELLAYDRPLAARLHAQDRVHTYGSFHVADLVACR